MIVVERYKNDIYNINDMYVYYNDISSTISTIIYSIVFRVKTYLLFVMFSFAFSIDEK